MEVITKPVRQGSGSPTPAKLPRRREDDKPHILHVVDSLEVGGLERLVHDLSSARSGRTSIACLCTVGPFGERLRKRGIPVDLIGAKGGFAPTVWRMRKHLRRVQPDLVHCHNHFSFLNGSAAARLAGNIPVVMTKHGASVPGTGLGSRTNRFLIRGANVVAVSHESMAILKAWKTDNRPVHYIPNGISVDAYENLPTQAEARAELGLPVESFVAGIVARLTVTKGHSLLIDAFARLQRKLPNIVLLIVGDGAELPRIKAHIRRLGCEKSILAMGERQDVPMILASLDVFCLPSQTEGMPMTILEAMAAGLPVVASDVGGIPELVEEGRTGLMVPPRAEDELEAALLALARDPERARAMGQAGRARLLREFSVDRTLGAYEELYQATLAERRK